MEVGIVLFHECRDNLSRIPLTPYLHYNGRAIQCTSLLPGGTISTFSPRYLYGVVTPACDYHSHMSSMLWYITDDSAVPGIFVAWLAPRCKPPPANMSLSPAAWRDAVLPASVLSFGHMAYVYLHRRDCHIRANLRHFHPPPLLPLLFRHACVCRRRFLRCGRETVNDVYACQTAVAVN